MFSSRKSEEAGLGVSIDVATIQEQGRAWAREFKAIGGFDLRRLVVTGDRGVAN
jgi:hypothetical protein